MIKLIRQELDNTCAQACIAMVTGRSFTEVHDVQQGMMDSRQIEHLLAHFGYMTQNTPHNIPHGVCLLTVPSLNTLGLNHLIVFETLPDGFQILDPNNGRKHKNFYTAKSQYGEDLHEFPLRSWTETLSISVNEYLEYK